MGCNPSYTQLWPGTSHQRPRNGWLRRWGDLWSSLRNQVLIQTSQPLFWYQLWRSLCEKWGGLDCAMYSHHCHTVILQMKHHGHWTVSLKSVTVVKFLLCVRVHVCLLTSVVSDSLWPMYLARQAPLSMGFSRQEYCNRLPCPPPGDLPDPGIKPSSLVSPAL